MTLFSRLFRAVGVTKRSRPQRVGRRTPLLLESLEDRCTPTAGVSSIVSNFNGTAIPANDTVWFSSVFKASNLGAGPVTLFVTNQTVSFSVNGNPQTVTVPDATITFSPTATQASTVFDTGSQTWETTLPMQFSGNAFLAGAALTVPGGLPGGIKPVTWQAQFMSDTAGVNINWQWAASVYKSFGSEYAALNVKAVDDNHASAIQNSDHAGTPEAFKSFVLGGARGGGGSNYTGSYSATASVTPSVGTPTPESPTPALASLSGQFQGITGGPDRSGVTITLFDATTGQIVGQTTTDALGNYSFTGLSAGTYNVQVTLPAAVSGYIATSAVGTVNGNLDGSGSGGDTIFSVVLNAGDAGINYNFNDFSPTM